MKRGNTIRCFTAFLAVIMLIASVSTFPGPMQDATDSLGLVVTAEAAVTYYPKCNSKYTSIVDALNSIGVNSSLSNRKSIAQLNGINNYTGTAAQNTAMLNLLKQGKLIKSKTADVTPKVTLSSTSVNLDLSGTKSRTITATRSYSGNCYLSYETSGNSNYASFSWGQWQNNYTSIPLTINGLNPGSFQLRVKMYDSASKQLVATSSVVTVTVSRSSQALPSGSVSLSHGSVNLDLNGTKTQTINATRNYSRDCYFSYETSGNSNYASLSWGQWQNNFTYCPLTISGLNTGSFQLRIKMYDQATKSLVATTNWITVTVKKTNSTVAVTGIKLNKTSASVKTGNTVALTATISPSNATNKSVTWSSNNTKVATVSGGTVKGVAAGTATITAKSNNGKTATCKVTVTKASSSVSYAAYNGVNYAKQTTNTKRIAALDKAKRMVTIKWKAPCDFVSWKSKGGSYNTVYDTSGKGAKKFVKNHIYTGVPYSMAGRDWDENGLKNALDKGIVTSSYMKKNWQGRTNTTAHGVDCSKFVYYALKAANTKTKLSSDLTTSTIPTCGAFTKVKGGFSSMKPGDVINKKGDHVRLYVGRNKKKYAFFESAGGDSRCVYREYTEAELKGYTPYRFKGFGD